MSEDPSPKYGNEKPASVELPGGARIWRDEHLRICIGFNGTGAATKDNSTPLGIVFEAWARKLLDEKPPARSLTADTLMGEIVRHLAAEDLADHFLNHHRVWLCQGCKEPMRRFALAIGMPPAEIDTILADDDGEGGVAAVEPAPIPMLLYCPNCGEQHVDKPQPEKGWANPPHRSHECWACSWVWRPADVATTGVAEISTRGSAMAARRPSSRASFGRFDGSDEAIESLDELDAEMVALFPELCAESNG